MLKQAIAGVAPPELGEVTIMTVWPTIAANPLGRLLGRLYSIRLGLGNILTIGNILALLTIPIALGLFAWGLAPFVSRRYRLTNRRLIVERGLAATDERSVLLSDFDAVQVDVLPGQGWYPAGDLIFRKGQVETFRLSGVSRPETFKRTCLKAQQSYTGVQRVMQYQAANQ